MCAAAAAEVEIGGYIGGAHTQDSYLRIRQATLGNDLRFGNVGYSGNSFQGPLYYGARGGYFFHQGWGVEAEFIHLKVFADVASRYPVNGTLAGAPINANIVMNTIVQRFSISHDVNLLMANVAFRHQLWRTAGEKLGRVMLHFRFGMGATVPHAESEILGRSDEHYQAGRMVAQGSAAAELKLAGHVYWLGEYKFTRTRQSVDVSSGTAETLLQTHHLVTGPVIHF